MLYVGKAKNLFARVSSYFRGDVAQHTLKTQLLIARVRKIDYIVTRTEREALILEDQLVKSLQPRFNILLKDDKSYPYIKITVQEPFPRLWVVRQKIKDGAKYYGPYPSLGSTKRLQRLFLDLFPIRDCKQPIDLVNRQPKCIKLDIQKCIGPCVIKSVKAEYDRYIHQMELILEGKNKVLLTELDTQMSRYADQREYEKAAEVRDKIQKLKELGEHQWVKVENLPSPTHVWGSEESQQWRYAVIQEIIDGQLLYQSGFYESIEANAPEAFLAQCWAKFYEEHPIPRLILINDRMAQTQSYLPLPGAPKIQNPKKGDKRRLVEAADRNAKHALFRIQKETIKKITKDWTPIAKEMQRILNLSRIPYRIVGIDVSHLGGTEIVSSAVWVDNGIPVKTKYKQFKIRTVNEGKSNDTASIYETVRRWVGQLRKQESPFPDLVLIDGGKGQLRFAAKALADENVQDQMDLASLAKREEELYTLNSPYPFRLGRNHGITRYCQTVRDEAHRFALRYQQIRRKKQMESSVKLIKIQGIGPKRMAKLYQKFGGISGIRNASREEVAAVGRIGNELATRILDAVKDHS